MANELKWNQGIPEFDGLYLVAVRYPNGLGELDLYLWNGIWVSLYDEEPIPEKSKVVGYVTASGIMEAFRGNWPSWDTDE
jgi:hypothetical protein